MMSQPFSGLSYPSFLLLAWPTRPWIYGGLKSLASLDMVWLGWALLSLESKLPACLLEQLRQTRPGKGGAIHVFIFFWGGHWW